MFEKCYWKLLAEKVQCQQIKVLTLSLSVVAFQSLVEMLLNHLDSLDYKLCWNYCEEENWWNIDKMTTSDIAFLRKLAEIKRTGNFKISMEQLRRLDHIKQGQFTTTITEDEEPMAPKFLTDIQDAEVILCLP